MRPLRPTYASLMTNRPPVGSAPDEEDDTPSRSAWELPEIVAVSVLVAFFGLVVGGLVTAIVVGTTPIEPSPGNQLVGEAIQLGAEWADPLLTALLLAVLGLCWWQFQAWAAAAETTSDDEQTSEVLDHLRRARLITIWTQAALALTALGSVALFAGGILTDTGLGTAVPRTIWARDIYAAASVLAVFVLVGVGLLVGKRLGELYAPVDPGEEVPA